MSLTEVLPDVQALSRLDKIHLIQFLARELERDEGGLIEPGQSYPLWSPDRAFSAAAALLQALEKEKTRAEEYEAGDRKGEAAMNDPVRAELLARLGELGRTCPEMRFGQLIANLAVVARGIKPSAVWDMEDEELLAAVNWQLTELMARRGAEVA
jgi:hypothetical protein